MLSELALLIREVYGGSVKVVHSHSADGGCINDAQILTLSNGEKAFLKQHSDPPNNFFQREAHGLDLLRYAQAGLRVPKILSVRHPNYFLMEYIPQESPKLEYYDSFGRALAKMHRITKDYYGLDRDNYIGKTVQRNSPNKDPIVFYQESRIKYQQDLARKRKLLPKIVDCRLDAFCEKLGDFLNMTNEKPALSHGDLWSGNHFCGPNQEPCIIDPAVYYGLREADLAMTELFGALPRHFYEAYRETFPLSPGYKERRGIYNLYHLLNHLNLFGSSYLNSIKNVLAHYLG